MQGQKGNKLYCTIQDKKVNLQMQIKLKCAKSTTFVKFNYILMWNLDGVI